MKYVGIGTRVLNFIIDTLLVFAISLLCNRARQFYVYYYQATPWPFYYFFWLIMVVYYFIFESFFGRTPGKWLTMSKVVNDKGSRPAIWQVFVRSILRVTLIIDCLFIPFTDRTLHDFASKTGVVEI
jgi:uncharacterized RDD family membrane protein YckC